ncbi:MAG: serine/threonine protein kinase [Sandaracinaceae bacterium]
MTGSLEEDTRLDAPGTVRLSDAPAPVTTETRLPDSSGRYAPGPELGRGAMGSVRESTDRYLGRVVAQKTLLDADSGRSRSRFLREVRIQAQLEHPSILPVYDLAVGHDAPSFTMKRVRGVTLRDAIRDGLGGGEPRFAPRRLLAAFCSVCLTVDYAHRRGVIHRDLKPNNVMLGSFGEVYVLDWGVARVESDDAEDGPVVLGPGAGAQHTRCVGTPGYIAPEVERGDSAGDVASDVYSLGAMLFEIVSGHRLAEPFDDAARVEPVGVDPRSRAEELGVSVPPELLAACERALGPASDRYVDARALHDAVQAYLDGDRDLALRRDTADELTHRALDRLDTGTPDDERHALRDLLAALALAPTHERALRALHRLLAEPPREVPREVIVKMNAVEDARLVGMSMPARWTALLGIPAVLVAAIAMGVRDATLVAWGTLVAVSIATAVGLEGWRAARRQPSGEARDGRRDLGTLVLLGVGAATCSVVAGPFVIAPAFATSFAVVRVLRDPRRHWLVVAAFGVALIAPLALEAAGWLAPNYVMSVDAWTIVPRALQFPRGPTLAFGVISALAVLMGTTGIVARFRRELEDVELRNQLYQWRLGQLLPRDAGAATGA